MPRKYTNLATSFADSDPAFSWAWKNLEACFLFERPQASVVRDVVTGFAAFFTAGSSGTKPAWAVDGTGASVQPVDAGDSSGIILDNHPGLGDSFTPETLTLELWAITPPDDDTDPRGISKQSGGGADDHDWMLGVVNSGGAYQGRCRLSTGGSTTTHLTFAAMNIGVLTHFVARYDGAEVQIWIDGVSVSMETDPPVQTGTVDATAGMPIKIGNAAYSSATNEWDDKIYKAAIYSRALTDWEIVTLARDPVRPFQRGPGLVLEGPAAAVGANPKGPLGHPFFGPFAGPIAA